MDILSAVPEEHQKEILKLVSEYEAAKKRELAQSSFLDFAQAVWPDIILGEHIEIMADAFERIVSGENKRLIINMPPRHKLLVTEKIPTTEGFKAVADIRAGDEVFGVDGTPVKVTGKSSLHLGEIYEVVTSDGAVIKCDADHLWTVRYGCSVEAPYKTMSTAEVLSKQEECVSVNWVPKLPVVNAVKYPIRDLPVPPYVLGAWLGDGASSCGTMGAHPDDAEFIRGRFESLGIPTTDLSTKYIFGTLGLMSRLRDLGVLNNKHIPETYLTASIEQRMELIRGLIDTDGSVGKRGRVTFHSSNLNLADQFCELVRSMGVKARVTSRSTHYLGVPSKESYRVMFKLEGAASLPRKASRTRNLRGNKSRTIYVRKTGKVGKFQCLSVDNNDGLFLAGRGYVVTHNSKSEMSSFLLPAYFLGRHPNKKLIQSSHTADLAVDFGYKVRNLIGSKRYQEIFPHVGLMADKKAAGKWATTEGGEYYAIGVGGSIAGRGADLYIIDDPHSERDAIDALGNPELWDKAYEWYTGGPRQRLQPGGAIVIVMTRWNTHDLTGQVLKSQKDRGVTEWEIIELPAILPSGNILWPEFWKEEEIFSTREELPVSKWQAQYQQNPTSEEGALLKREWWQEWKGDEPPKCYMKIVSWDTAFLKTERSDYSACTVWGVFDREDEDGRKRANLILLDAFKDKYEFPELKKEVLKVWNREEPDMMIVEQKASGTSLISELRWMGVPVQEFTPTKGNDKIARANTVSDLFASGIVWHPPRRWAYEVIEECASFPHGRNDDYVDSTTQALIRFRRGGFIRPDMDEDEIEYDPPVADYYQV